MSLELGGEKQKFQLKFLIYRFSNHCKWIIVIRQRVNPGLAYRRGRGEVSDLLSCWNLASLVEQKHWSSLEVEGSGSLDKACRVEMHKGSRRTTDRNSWRKASISCRGRHRARGASKRHG